MDQSPKKFSAIDYIIAIGAVIVINILSSVILLGVLKGDALSFVYLWMVNVVLYFCLRETHPPWAVGFLVYIFLMMVPVLIGLGLLGLCVLVGGN